MTDDILSDEILMDLDEPGGVAKICPILNSKCLKSKCAWHVRDWNEERNRYNVDCALVLIAIGVNDESLFRLRGRSPSQSV